MATKRRDQVGCEPPDAVDNGAMKIEELPSQVQHVKFEYKYDPHGNWIERIVVVVTHLPWNLMC